ncbi:MAG TPA: hypothetical protein VGE16_05625 [Albitalea sp.]
MPNEHDRKRPEAGADTDPEGKNPRAAESGGHRSASGGTYGDFVPDRGQPRRNDDRDADEPKMGDYYSGGGNIDRLAEQPVSPGAPQAADTDAEKDEAAESEEERIAEANRNKSFDTTHVHSSTTTRKV